jgi:hypothetical protein
MCLSRHVLGNTIFGSKREVGYVFNDAQDKRWHLFLVDQPAPSLKGAFNARCAATCEEIMRCNMRGACLHSMVGACVGEIWTIRGICEAMCEPMRAALTPPEYMHMYNETRTITVQTLWWFNTFMHVISRNVKCTTCACKN